MMLQHGEESLSDDTSMRSLFGWNEKRSVVTPAGTARAEDPLGQAIFLTKLAEAVPAASIHR
ncbi:hypothetical protein [Halobacillus litoralis]|uniref:hypothetical protein n=1 Tax=Halobacillus litoralis TaxID=45668 RepID=UPI001F41A6E7|nr:hypothetical protein [Halobacillus litoralis]